MYYSMKLKQWFKVEYTSNQNSLNCDNQVKVVKLMTIIDFTLNSYKSLQIKGDKN